MALFQAADLRLAVADPIGQLALGQPGAAAQVAKEVSEVSEGCKRDSRSRLGQDRVSVSSRSRLV